MINNPVICPLCGDEVHKLVYRFHIESEKVVIEKIKQDNPSWSERDGLCGRCVDYYQTQIILQQQTLPGIGPHFRVKSPDDFIVLPTPLRLNADLRFTGKGVTICFIDSGFFPHPDLTATSNRIRAMIDITDPCRDEMYFMEPHQHSWHGTMTTVVCAGDGYSSDGLYKSIAPNAELVLLKVQDDAGRITTRYLEHALEWVLQHCEAFNIRIVNMSVSDDLPTSYKESKVDMLAEALFRKGVSIVAAIGNDEHGLIKPPANSPFVIAVGGIDDNNSIDEPAPALYHSSYGRTTDGLMKPELTAHAAWIAAPILPGTPEKQEAEFLHAQLQSKNDLFEVAQRNIQLRKYISPAYMHVDGTSFAAPIVSAVIAQLLEIDPGLTPAQIRQILFSTARPFPGFPIERQGFGYVQARRAVIKALHSKNIIDFQSTPSISIERKTIAFFIQHECASQVSLAGSFNNWARDVLMMEPGKEGVWQIEIPMLPKGKYQYKFFIDEHKWVEDVCNPFREPDGLNGWNSVLYV